MLFMRFDKLLIGEFDDLVGVAARYGRVLAVLKRLAEDGEIQRFIRVAQRALHLVIHDALIIGLAAVANLDMPALLTEGVFVIINQRAEYRVGINRHQVHQILLIHAGHGIHRLVREGHRVEKSIQRALHQLNKRIVDRITL